ncbi:hypothetical protein R1flu_004586 [Riccia fluitans]|uniref:Uncharacterized protein n=1 Tax=Riccia fluitans TaxID=41844 RepID=A0ABD1YQR7_9MARC
MGEDYSSRLSKVVRGPTDSTCLISKWVQTAVFLSSIRAIVDAIRVPRESVWSPTHDRGGKARVLTTSGFPRSRISWLGRRDRSRVGCVSYFSAATCIASVAEGVLACLQFRRRTIWELGLYSTRMTLVSAGVDRHSASTDLDSWGGVFNLQPA